jgi:hypothetical protein
MPLPAGWAIAVNKQPVPPTECFPFASVPATGTDPVNPTQPAKVQLGTEKGEPIRYQGTTQRPAVPGVGTSQQAGRTPALVNQIAAAEDLTPLAITNAVAGKVVTLTISNATGAVRVQWGDNTFTDRAVAPATLAHTYAAAGTYSATIEDYATRQFATQYVKPV